jgi:hypothetical protein
MAFIPTANWGGVGAQMFLVGTKNRSKYEEVDEFSVREAHFLILAPKMTKSTLIVYVKNCEIFEFPFF